MIDAFVHDGDLVFWDASPRRLMKIHGSITNFGSIVATRDDYNKSFKRLNDGPLGSHMKSLISRKTVLYVGYSLSDDNYLRLLRNIAKMMGATTRQSYFISPNIDHEKLKNAPIPLIPIETDGAFFFENVRKRLSSKDLIVGDDAFGECEDLLSRAASFHITTADAFTEKKHPLLIFALSYQDGLVLALKRIRTRRKSAEYHSPDGLHSRAHAYGLKYRERYDAKDYWNASYALGYRNGMMSLLIAHATGKKPKIALIDLPFDIGVQSLSGICRFPKKMIPKSVMQQVKRLNEKFPGLGNELIPDHTPYL